MRTFVFKWLPFLLALVLIGCTSTSQNLSNPNQPGEVTSRLERDVAAQTQPGDTVFRLSPRDSQVRILVFRGGKAPQFGHNHVLTAPRFTGFLRLPQGNLAQLRFDLALRWNDLELDDPAVRAELGPEFESRLDGEARADTWSHLVGVRGVDAGRFPEVVLHGEGLAEDGATRLVRVSIRLHGRSQELKLPVQISNPSGQWVASGQFILRQTDFGIRPYSVLGGLIAVRDTVKVTFELHANPL